MRRMRKITKPSLLMLGLLLVAVGAAAQPTVSASGQFLVVDGVVAENGAILKIVGPGGFGFMQNLARGKGATIDLIAISGERALQPGIYYYEVVSRPGGKTVTGSFSIGGDSEGGPIAAEDPIPLALTLHQDAISIQDAVDDGITTLDFDSDGNTFDLHWTLVNEQGFLKFKEHTSLGQNEAGSGTTNVSFMRQAAGGGIGIGTDTALSSLDIQKSAPIINLTDTDGGTNWKLINSGGDFILQSDCAFDCEFLERWNVVTLEDGALEDSLIINSSGVSLSSSRTVKKNIEPAASAALLEQLAELPIYTWSYAADSTDTIHVGPMAEDFHHRFGFGSDEKRLSSIDTGGLALAAIQGLHQEAQDKDSKIQALERRLETLERLIASSP